MTTAPAAGASPSSSKTSGGSGGGAFSLTIVLVAVVVGIVAFAAFIVLLAFADDLRNPEDGGEHALSKSAVGFAGLVSLLEGENNDVRINRSPLREFDRGVRPRVRDFFVLTPPPGREIEMADLYGILGDTLIVLPKWSTYRNKENSEWVVKEGLLPAESVEATFRQIDYDVSITHAQAGATNEIMNKKTGARIPVGGISNLQTISGGRVTPILTDDAGRVVLGAIQYSDDEDLIGYVLSDPDLLNTQGLASLETAHAGLEAFESISAGRRAIVFDMTLQGVEHTRNILQLLLTPPFLSAVLCLVFAGILVAITAFAGNLRTRGTREIPLGKTTLVDNSALLISLAGRSAGMGVRYAAMARRQAAVAVGVPAGASEAQQIAMLDTIGRNAPGGNGETFSQLQAAAGTATSSSAMLRAIIRIYSWKRELGRDRKRR